MTFQTAFSRKVLLFLRGHGPTSTEAVIAGLEQAHQTKLV